MKKMKSMMKNHIKWETMHAAYIDADAWMNITDALIRWKLAAIVKDYDKLEHEWYRRRLLPYIIYEVNIFDPIPFPLA